MFRPYRSLSLAILLIGSLIVPGVADDFGWKFQKGEHYKFTVDQKMAQQIPTPQGVINTKVAMKITGLWDVADVTSDGNMVLEQRISRMVMNIKAPGPQGETVIDTDNLDALRGPLAAQVGPGLNNLKKLRFTKTISPLGKVVKMDVKGVAAGGFAGITPESLKEMTGDLLLEFPAKSLDQGRTWKKTQTQKVPNVGELKIVTEYKYAGIEEIDGKKLAKFELDGDVGSQKDADGKEAAQKVSGKVSGTLYFDRESGRISHGGTTAKMDVPLSILGQSITVKMTVTANMKLEKVAQKIESSQGSP